MMHLFMEDGRFESERIVGCERSEPAHSVHGLFGCLFEPLRQFHVDLSDLPQLSPGIRVPEGLGSNQDFLRPYSQVACLREKRKIRHRHQCEIARLVPP
jgi:hypothetical protein